MKHLRLTLLGIKRSILLYSFNIILLTIVSNVVVHAQSTWTGTVDNSWANPDNWSDGAPGTTHGSGSQVVFGSNNLDGDPLTLDGTYYLNSLTIAAADYGVDTKQLASGGTLVFQAHNGIDPSMTFGMVSTDAGGIRDLALGADIEIADTLTLTRLGFANPTNPRRILLNGVISGDGDIIIDTSGSSSGQAVAFRNHNTFTGDVYMQRGYISQLYADSLGDFNKTLHFGDAGPVTWDLTSGDAHRNAAAEESGIGYNLSLFSAGTATRTLLLHAGTIQRQFVVSGDITGGSPTPSTVSLHLIAQNNQQLIFTGETMDFSGTVRVRYGSEVVVANANEEGIAWENVANVFWSEAHTLNDQTSGFLLRGNYTFNGDVTVADTVGTDKVSVGQINHEGQSYGATFNGDINILEVDYRKLNLISEDGGNATFNGDIIVAGEQGMDINDVVNSATSGGTLNYYEETPTGTVIIGEEAHVASTAGGTGSIGTVNVLNGALLVNTGHFYGVIDVAPNAHLGGIGAITMQAGAGEFVYLAENSTLSPGQGAADPIGSLAITGGGVYLDGGATILLDVASATFNIGSTAVADVTTVFASELNDVGDHDHLTISGTLTINEIGAVELNLLDGFLPSYGDAFNLLDFGFLDLQGANAVTMWDLPDLSDFNLEWNYDLAASHGVLLVVPEPSRLLLLGAGLLVVLLTRPRRSAVVCGNAAA